MTANVSHTEPGIPAGPATSPPPPPLPGRGGRPGPPESLQIGSGIDTCATLYANGEPLPRVALEKKTLTFRIGGFWSRNGRGGGCSTKPPPYLPRFPNHRFGRISARSYTSLGLIWDPLFEQNPSFLQGFIRFWLQKGVQNRAGLRPAELAAAGRNVRGGVCSISPVGQI